MPKPIDRIISRNVMIAIYGLMMIILCHSVLPAQWSQSQSMFPNLAVPYSDTEEGPYQPTLDVVVDSRHNIHLVWCDQDQGRPEILYTVRENGQWSDPVVISNSDGISFLPNLAIDRHDRIHCTWTEWDGQSLSQICYAEKPIDSTWSHPFIISDPNRYLPCHSIIAIDSSDNLHIMWNDFSQPDDEINNHYYLKYRIKSTDGNWSDFMPTPGNGEKKTAFRPIPVFDRNNRLHTFWYDRSANDNQQTIIHTVLNGTVWLPEDTLYKGGIDNDFGIDACCDTDNRLYAVWYDFTDDKSILIHLDNSGQWSMPIPLNHSPDCRLVIDSRHTLHMIMLGQETSLDYRRYSNDAWIGETENFGQQIHRIHPCPELIICRDTLFCFSLGMNEEHPTLLYHYRAIPDISPVREASINHEITSSAIIQTIPNPFNNQTTIRYYLPTLDSPFSSGRVSLIIYDLLGRPIRHLADSYLTPNTRSASGRGPSAGGGPSAGWQQIVWNGRSDLGTPLPTGIYFYHLNYAGTARSGRMTLIK